MKKVLLITFILLSSSVFSQGWIQQTSGAGNNILTSVWFVDSQTGWASGGYGGTSVLVKTTNGGVNWVSQSIPTAKWVLGLYFFNSLTGYGVGGTEAPMSSLIIKTTDGGTTWTELSSGSPFLLISITFTNSTNGYISGNGGTILRTTNGGTNWTNQSFGVNEWMQYMSFVDINTGWVVGTHGIILKTTNAGLNWISQTSGTSNELRGVFFVSANNGWAVGEMGTIIKTTNGGNSWTLNSVATTDRFCDVNFVSSQTGWIVGGMNNTSCKILKTTNGGINWFYQIPNVTAQLESIFFLNSLEGYLVGNNGVILKTTTGGELTPSAPTLLSPSNNSISNSITPSFDWTDVSYANKFHLQVASDANFTNIIINENQLLSSQFTTGVQLAYNTDYYWRVYAGNDYGWSTSSTVWNFRTTVESLWSLYQTGVPYSLFGVDFSTVNNNIGVAVGQGGTVIKTTDAGAEWTLTYSNINIWMNDVQFDPNTAGVVWAAGMGGVIIKSTDYGSTWTVVRPFSTPDHTIRGIATKPDNSGQVSFIGYAGTFFETYNNGSTFVQRFDIPYTMHSIAYSPNFSVDGRGIISGTDGKVWNTTNHGTNWIARNTNRYDYLNDVVFLNPDVAMICGNNGTILRSTNWGKNWTVNVQYLTSEHLRSIDAYVSKVTVCGDNGKIMTSNDAGITFIDQLNGENRNFYGVALRQSNVGVVVGEVGTAGISAALYYTTMNGGTVSITNTETEIPKNYSISQNYPNPFNPMTKIKFAIPKSSGVRISVYDITGKEVKVLVNEHLQAGTYQTDWNATQYPSGVYFYRMVTDGFCETRKMMLVK